MPGIADNALVHAATLIERIAAYTPEPQIQQEVEAFFSTVLGEVPPPREASSRAHGVSELAGALIDALLGPTFAPTLISASRKRTTRTTSSRSSTAATAVSRRLPRTSCQLVIETAVTARPALLPDFQLASAIGAQYSSPRR